MYSLLFTWLALENYGQLLTLQLQALVCTWMLMEMAGLECKNFLVEQTAWFLRPLQVTSMKMAAVTVWILSTIYLQSETQVFLLKEQTSHVQFLLMKKSNVGEITPMENSEDLLWELHGQLALKQWT